MFHNDGAARLAATMLTVRRARAQLFPPEMFADPAWDLLLELFIADARGVRLTGFDVCKNSGIRPSTLPRWLRYMTEEGLVVGDGLGNLRDELTLSAKALANIEAALAQAVDSPSSFRLQG